MSKAAAPRPDSRIGEATNTLFLNELPELETFLQSGLVQLSIVVYQRMWFNRATYLALFAFGCTTTTAKPKSADKFKDFHTKSLSSTPLRLDDNIYVDLTSGPRNYTAVVLLTALDARFGCQLCKDFQPEWEVLSKSWTKGDRRGESRTLYAQLDFADGKGTFQKVFNIYIYISLPT